MLIFALLAAATAAQPVYPDPIAPAAAGQAQCYTPDTTRKVCNSMSYYTVRPDGTFDNTAVVLLAPTPVVIIQSVTPVHVANGAICGTIQTEQIAAATLTVDGKTLAPAQAAPILARLTTAMQAVIGQEICTQYIPDGQQLTAKATMNGAPQPPDQKVIWVSPNDDYRVAP